MTEGLALPQISEWPDERLLQDTPKRFTERLFKRALAVANDIYDPQAYDTVDLDQDTYRRRLSFYLERRAWAEWYFGVETPGRQILMLPEDAIAVKLALADQIADETRHHRIFKHWARTVGRNHGQPFNPPEGLLQMHAAQEGRLTAEELAAANQFSGEISLQVQARSDRNILRALLEEDLMEAIEEIEEDEPAHIAIGRALVLRGATRLPLRRRMARIQEQFLAALANQHATEIQMLGCLRSRRLPQYSREG